ncbi:23S rRNA (uracil(1939)-C(5))-methyltransferase RlmD [Neisseria shayeganii]|uniref:23S rRNA (uracil(1939)-C(5))-methyltransferase RlmD n=1 Tax=Neisseria shayeganii TaxID=607712 RepID=A0A7D7S5C9_9NEIS|nr:23S rRNA (uracil(1939)-C(5))-methyltransferase RlmD [Neisseria shayeganii]QMT40766.1 23S rRNA (uracil(1939)-C(5))-methyltransferase RlmD [Neisseria shayeganii]
MNIATIQGIDHEGRGIARVDGKAVFIEGALPQETVSYRLTRSKKHFDEAEMLAVLQPSPHRISPRCRHYRTCGGCSWQHVRSDVQVAYKQRILEEQLQRLANIQPQQYLPAIYGRSWGYRQRARLSVAHPAGGKAVFGFQSRHSHRIVDIQECPVLSPPLAEQLASVRCLLNEVAGADIGAVELHQGEEACALTLHGRRFPPPVLAVLRKQAAAWSRQGWQLYLQTGRQAEPLLPAEAGLFYRLPEYGLTLPYRPGDFTQINADTNALMVRRALALLAPQAGERIADLFCGLGNFSLPIAACGAETVGMEGAAALTERAEANARLNGLAGRTRFIHTDLFDTTPQTVAEWGRFDKMLLDPPRSGAYAVVQALHTPYLPKRIVYVSCNPATFARDAAVLVQKGYRFRSAGIINLFAQTAHVETVACFDWGE